MAGHLYRQFGKRALDLALVIPGLLVLALPMAVLSLVIGFKLGWPVFFRQRRPGLRGRPFILLKFRSMNEARGADGQLLPDEARIIRFGRFLRNSSLDELPELMNVLKGEMSLVGPRPLLMQYLNRYTPAQAHRHDVPPGITGWAQVQWPQRHHLGREVCTGPMVCGKPNGWPGPENNLVDDQEGIETRGYQRRGPCIDAGVCPGTGAGAGGAFG